MVGKIINSLCDVVVASPRALVVEGDAVDGERLVRLPGRSELYRERQKLKRCSPVVDDRPVGEELGHSVGRPGDEGRGLALRTLRRLAKHLRGRRLEKPNVICQIWFQTQDPTIE